MQIGMPIAKMWSLNIPVVYRFLEEEYVRAFFEDGSLMLTTLSRCRNHEDDSKKDTQEGSSNFQIGYDDGQIAGISNLGENNYILCGSLNHSDKLIEKFQAENFIQINDVLSFCGEISRKTPWFESGKLGSCVYKDERKIKRKSERNFSNFTQPLSDFFETKDQEKIEKAFYQTQERMPQGIERELSDEQFFLKNSSFVDEVEFRMIWETSQGVNNVLHIKCPEAIQYCSPGILN